jgi:AraC-like DNA-binding protein
MQASEKNNARISHTTRAMLAAGSDISAKYPGIGKDSDAYLLIPMELIESQEVLKDLTRLRFKLDDTFWSIPVSEITQLSESATGEHFMQKILGLMDENIDDDGYGITELCDELGMSRSQLYRKFRLFSHKTLHSYLRSYRLQKAKSLLINTKRTVSEAAYLTGFKNVSHFCRIFANEYGKSPGKLKS